MDGCLKGQHCVELKNNHWEEKITNEEKTNQCIEEAKLIISKLLPQYMQQKFSYLIGR